MILFEWGFDGLHPAERRVIGKLWRLRGRWLGTIRYGVMDDRIPRQNGLGQTTAEDRVDLILIIIILVLLFGGGFGYRRWGYGGGIGIGGILLIVLIVYLLFGCG